MTLHRIAVVGCGLFSENRLLPALVANPRVNLAAVCDQDPLRAEACRDAFGAGRAVTRWQELIDAPDVDLIVLATHTGLRGELIVPALEAGKPVFTEKPLAASDADMVSIVKAARRTGTPLCVDHNRRSSPAMADLASLLNKARTTSGGWPPSVDRTRGGRDPIAEERQLQLLIRINDDCRSWPDWIFGEPGGILLAEMVHYIDVALWLNPSMPAVILGAGSPRGNFTGVIRFNDGSLTTIQQSLTGHFDYPKELIEASVNHVTLCMEHHVELRQRGLADEPFRRSYPPFRAVGPGEPDGVEAFHAAVSSAFERSRATGEPPAVVEPDKGHAAHLDRFLAHVEGRAPNPCDAASACRATRLTFRLLQAVQQNTPVPIPPADLDIDIDID